MPQPKQSAYSKFVADIESKGGEVGIDTGPPVQLNVRLPGLGVITSRGQDVQDAVEKIDELIATLSD